MCDGFSPSQICVIVDSERVMNFKSLKNIFPFAKDCNNWLEVMDKMHIGRIDRVLTKTAYSYSQKRHTLKLIKLQGIASKKDI